jgi:zinc protease
MANTRSRRIGLLLALAALALAAAGPAGGREPPAPDPAVPAAPALRSGALPNGLRYVLLPQRTVADHVSLRLVVEAGSLDERADERGYAHFVEHMAFEGTTHYPAGRLVLFLQGLGLGFGADLNADTSFTHTIYKLDLPAGRYLPQALGILRDYADGLVFPEYALDRQRGVVLSELSARATAQSEANRGLLDCLYAGTPLPDRMPIGDAGLIVRADAARLRAFYRRCYRPERMIVLVTGDFAPAAVEPLVRSQFATLAAAGPPLPPARFRLPPAPAGLRADVLDTPLQTSAAADVIALVPRARDTVADRRAWVANTMVVNLLNRRLTERADADSRIGRAFAVVDSGPDDWYAHFRLEAQAATANWPLAVGLLEAELRRARQQGFQAEEIAEAASDLEANLLGFRDETAVLTPAALADALAGRLVAGLSWPDLDAEIGITSATLRDFGPAAAVAALNALFPPDRLHLVVSLPTALPGGPAAVLACFQAGAARPLASPPPVADDLPLFHYGDLLPAGSVVREQTDPVLRVTTAAFANGVRANLRPGLGKSHRFALSLRLGRGLADTPRAAPRLEMLALALLGIADLGRNSRDEISRLLRLHAITLNVVMDDGEAFLNASGPADELPFALRLFAATLSDSVLDPGRLNRAVSMYAAMQRREVSSTPGWARNEILFQMAGGDPRLRLSSPQQISRYPFADLGAWTRQHWLAGPLEIGLTGDFDPGEAVAALARTLGALPPRGIFPARAGESLVLRSQAVRRTEAEPLADEAAALRIAWPAPDARDAADQAALQLAVDAVVDRLRIRVREELGATYAPSGGIYRYGPQPDFGYAWIELTFDPRQAERLGVLALNLADEVGRHGLTPEEFARLREPRRAQVSELLASDEWWLHQILVRAQSRPEVLDLARGLAAAASAVTLEDVNRAAARHLRVSQATAVLVLPKATDASGPR